MRRLKASRSGYKIGAIPPGLFDATEKFLTAKRTEILFGIVCTVIAATVVLFMLAWLLYQIRVTFF